MATFLAFLIGIKSRTAACPKSLSQKSSLNAFRSKVNFSLSISTGAELVLDKSADVVVETTVEFVVVSFEAVLIFKLLGRVVYILRFLSNIVLKISLCNLSLMSFSFLSSSLLYLSS